MNDGISPNPRPRRSRILLHAGIMHWRGGIETYVYQLAGWLTQEGHEVILLTQSSRFPPAVRQGYLAMGVRMVDLGLTEKDPMWKRAWTVAAALSKLGPLDLCYSHGFGGIFALHRVLPRGCLWVHHHHLDINDEFLRRWGVLYRSAIRGAHHVITCTESQKRALQSSGIRQERIAAVPYLKPEGELVGRVRGADYVIGFAGVVKRNKGVDLLVAGAPGLASRGFRVRLWGNLYDLEAAELERAGLEIMGEFESAQLDGIAAAIDVFCLPSRFPEGLPLAVSEMLSRGVPVICTDSGGLRDLRGFHPLVSVMREASAPALIEAAERVRSGDTPAARVSLRERYVEELGNDVARKRLREVLALP